MQREKVIVKRLPLERKRKNGCMTSQIAAIAIDALETRLVAEFWCAVLGWRILEEDEEGISIGPSGGAGPTIDVFRVPERKTVKNRVHLDLRADGTSTADELERLEGLGARRVHVGQGPEASWTVLADPEGNEFCLLARSVQEVD